MGARAVSITGRPSGPWAAERDEAGRDAAAQA